MDPLTQGLLGAVTAQLGFRRGIGRDASWVAATTAAAADLEGAPKPGISWFTPEYTPTCAQPRPQSLRDSVAGGSCA